MQKHNIKNLGTKTLHEWLLKSEKVLLIDVREIEEFKSGYINSAKNLPLSSLTGNEDIIKNSHDEKIVIYCRAGVRSLKACEIVQEIYPEKEFNNLEGGILSWSANGFDINFK